MPSDSDANGAAFSSVFAMTDPKRDYATPNRIPKTAAAGLGSIVTTARIEKTSDSPSIP